MSAGSGDAGAVVDLDATARGGTGGSPAGSLGTGGDRSAAGPGDRHRPRRPSHWIRNLAWAVICAVVVLCFGTADISWSSLVDFPSNFIRYAGLMFGPPSGSTLHEALNATLLSVEMAWFGTGIGVLISWPLSFLATRGIGPWPVLIVVRGILGIFRAVPEVVLAILILSVTGLTAFTGALAIAMGSVGTLGKWGYETMESVDRGPVEAVRATGGSLIQIVRWGIWTSAQPTVLAFWLYRFEISVRASVVLGLIGAGGIGSVLMQNVQFRIWGAVGMLLIVVVVVTMIIDFLSGLVRRRLLTGRWSDFRFRPRLVPALPDAGDPA